VLVPKLEIKRTSTLSRKQVSERLIALGRALASGSEVELGSGGDSITVEVADHVEFELEIEVDGDETEIEIEISWRDGSSTETKPAAPAKKAAKRPAKKATRAAPRKSTA
jgi:amphi-Trp domain-containing protein